MKRKSSSKSIISIFSGDSIEAKIVSELLSDYGIQTNLKNEIMGTLAPWQISGGGTAPVEVEILASDQEKALKLIQDFQNNSTSPKA